MATITVVCPTCNSHLEIETQYRNREVECGSCNQVFLAKPTREPVGEREAKDAPRRSSRRSEQPRSRKSNRYEDEEDDYEEYEDRRNRRRRTQEGSGLGDASLILGVLGLFVFWCPIVGTPLTLVGLILGALGLRSIRNGTAIAGLILNILFFMVTAGFALMYMIRG